MFRLSTLLACLLVLLLAIPAAGDQVKLKLTLAHKVSNDCQLAQPSAEAQALTPAPAGLLAVVGGNPLCLVTLEIMETMDAVRWYIEGRPDPVASGPAFAFIPMNPTKALSLMQKIKAVGVKFESQDNVSGYQSDTFIVEIGMGSAIPNAAVARQGDIISAVKGWLDTLLGWWDSLTRLGQLVKGAGGVVR